MRSRGFGAQGFSPPPPEPRFAKSLLVMKADHVEPEALKRLVARASARRPARALAFNPENVRFAGQTRPTLRLSPPAAYKTGEACLCC